MFKRLLQIFIITFILSIPAVVMAAPDEMSTDDKGNATDLIILNNAVDEEITTFEENYILSGSGQEGVAVTLYVYNSESDKYQKVFITEEDIKKPVEWEIGASGLFAQQVDLKKGKNAFALRAELDEETYQVIKIDIKRQNKDFITKIKDLKIGIGNVLDTLMK
ncbi:MAG: hypothetical protein PWP27_2436 [Clostridiales bacterium]|jgi:hypothetical protein|nr:hypothetical protein [Clostridiales bacterium]MDK2934626.1 hypothetical protein [Clostridiales bacterium]